MQRSRTITTVALGLALAGAAGLTAVTRAARAEDAPAAAEESVRAKVERLIPDLLSDDAGTRERAERAIVALGEPAQAELERLTRDPDSQKAIAALKLLQSDAWRKRAASKDDAGKDARDRVPDAVRRILTPPDFDFEGWQRDLDRRMEEMRKRLSEWGESIDPKEWVPDIDWDAGAGAVVESRGVTEENGRRMEWSVDRDGKVKVTTRDGADAAEKTVEAPSLDALRKDHPDLAARLDPILSRGKVRRWTFTWPPRTPRSERADGAQPDRGPLSGAEPEEPVARDGDETLRLHDFVGASPGPFLGIGAGAVPEVLRDQLDLPEGGIVVESVTRDSIASRLGLRRNDILLRVADRAVAGPPDVRKALETVAAGGEVRVEILRKGKRETLTTTR